jgi:hypothetical protein
LTHKSSDFLKVHILNQILIFIQIYLFFLIFKFVPILNLFNKKQFLERSKFNITKKRTISQTNARNNLRDRPNSPMGVWGATFGTKLVEINDLPAKAHEMAARSRWELVALVIEFDPEQGPFYSARIIFPLRSVAHIVWPNTLLYNLAQHLSMEIKWGPTKYVVVILFYENIKNNRKRTSKGTWAADGSCKEQ